MLCSDFLEKFTRFNRRHSKGQVMLLTVLVLGGVILGASAIAGYLMMVKLRQATNVVNSTKAIFASDSGVECELYKYNFLNPQSPRVINCSALSFNGDVGVTTQLLNSTYVKSMGRAFGSRRSFTIDFAELVIPPQVAQIDLKERNCGRCSNDTRGDYIAWYAENGDCEAQFDQSGNKQIVISNYGPCVCGRCSYDEPSTYVEWAPYYNVCETFEAYNQDRQDYTCDSRCRQQPNCEDTYCSGGSCGENQTSHFLQWYGPGGDCNADQCFLQDSPTYNSPSCPYNGDCPTCDDGEQNQGEEGIDCGGPCSACPPPPEEEGTSTPPLGAISPSSGNIMASLFKAFQELFGN